MDLKNTFIDPSEKFRKKGLFHHYIISYINQGHGGGKRNKDDDQANSRINALYRSKIAIA